MLKIVEKLTIMWVTLTLCGCVGMPGMQSLDVSSIPSKVASQRVKTQAVLVPVTNDLLLTMPNKRYVYQIAPADVLEVTVWQHPEFNIVPISTTAGPSMQGASGQPGYLVNPIGNIYFPLVGNVHVEGNTVDQVREQLTKRLAKYIPNPQVVVRVGDFRGRKVYVWGEVPKPGFFPLTDQPLTIADALTMSGTIDLNAADPGHIYVIRGDLYHMTIYWLNARTPDKLLLAEHFNLQPDDLIYVSSAAATRINRVINQILPTVQTIWYVKTTTGA